MARYMATFVLGLLLLIPGAARSADNPAAGTWKLTMFVEIQRRPAVLTFLIMLSESDKGWAGDVLGVDQPVREPKFESVFVKDDNVTFTLRFQETPISFDGRVTKDGKKVRGSLLFQGRTSLNDLHRSKLKDMKDKFAVARDTLDSASEGDTDFFDAVFDVLSEASPKKLPDEAGPKGKLDEPKGKLDEPKGKTEAPKEKLDPPPKGKADKPEEPRLKVEEVRAIVDKAAKYAEPFGTRWQRHVSSRIASILVEQEPFVAIALEQARQLERMLRPDDPTQLQMEVLTNVIQILHKAGKLGEVKPLESRLTKLQARDYAEYSKKFPPFKPEEFKGRKGKSDRVILAELFTGADCPPCVAVDLAFDALQATYKPTDLAVLEYHVHASGPDPLTNRNCIERVETYAGKVRTMPGVLLDGKVQEIKGGSIKEARVKYNTLRETIDELLEKEAGAKLQLSATRKGNEITAKAIVSDLAKPGELVVLRFALTEERVRYSGSNGIRYHHNVVRAMPGGFKGFPLTKKEAEKAVTVNLDKVREDINKYLEGTKDDDFSGGDKPVALKNLRLIAFIQDDGTGEVIQAAQVEIEEK